jgi:hypothetical protein
MKGTVLRVVSGGTATAALMLVLALPLPASAAVTPLAHPTLEVSTPGADSYTRRGSIWVTGIACDPNAAASDPTAGIAKVSVFSGDRDDPTAEPARHNGRGGYLGSATVAGTLATGSGLDMTAVTSQTSRLSLGNPDVSICKNANAGWRVLTTALKKGAYTLNIIALGKNGMETTVTRDLRVDLG